MSDSANGKVGWVTGGSSGVGAATCRLLGAAGAKVLCSMDSDTVSELRSSVSGRRGQ